jgi:putative ABC transport system substrate-binding protein
MQSFLKLCFVVFLITLTGCQKEESAHEAKIGIIIPLEHPALTEIITGFKQAIAENYHQPVKIIEKNAQNDLNIQRAMIEQMRDENYDVIVPIGTSASQMANAIVHQKPIVSIAANINDEQRKAQKTCNMAIVHDNIPAEKTFEIIQHAYPHIQNIALIHSAEDKALIEVQSSITTAQKFNIKITPYMAATLPELSNIVNSLPKNTEAIFILKDNLMASGIATLIKAANDRHIPLVTSDQGTIEKGGSFAVGISEQSIGHAGGLLAIKILQDKKPCELPVVEMENLPLTLFIHTKENATLISAANEFHYALDIRN